MKNNELDSFKNPQERLKEAIEKDRKYISETIKEDRSILESFYNSYLTLIKKHPRLDELIEITEIYDGILPSFDYVLQSILESTKDIITSKFFECDEFAYSEYSDRLELIGKTFPKALKNVLIVLKNLGVEFKVITEDFEYFYNYEKNKLLLRGE